LFSASANTDANGTILYVNGLLYVSASGVTAGTSTFGAATPRQALRLYARLYINWTATTIVAQQRHLAAISQGTARAAALQAAASYRRDPELERSRVANTGAIVSLAAGQGPHRGWSSGEWMLMDWTAHLWNISDRQVVYPYNFDRHHFSRWITACHMRDHRTPAMTDSLGDPQ